MLSERRASAVSRWRSATEASCVVSGFGLSGMTSVWNDASFREGIERLSGIPWLSITTRTSGIAIFGAQKHAFSSGGEVMPGPDSEGMRLL